MMGSSLRAFVAQKGGQTFSLRLAWWMASKACSMNCGPRSQGAGSSAQRETPAPSDVRTIIEGGPGCQQVGCPRVDPAAPARRPRLPPRDRQPPLPGWLYWLDGTRDTRKPRKLNREPDMYHWRRAERQAQSVSNQPPPRHMRNAPSEGPCGSVPPGSASM